MNPTKPSKADYTAAVPLITEHTSRMVQMLHQTADRLIDLAGKLTDGNGRSLTQTERQLVRACFVPMVQDIANGIVMDYITGTPTDWRHAEKEVEAAQVY